jgi:hypothetical protein
MGADAVFVQFKGEQGNRPPLITSGVNIPAFLLGSENVGFFEMVEQEFEYSKAHNGNSHFISIFVQLGSVSFGLTLVGLEER